MKKQSFQHGEIRDQDDNIIQAGSYGKKTAFANGQNTGIIDYIINNLEVLFDGIVAAGLVVYDKDGRPVLPPEIKEALQSYVTTATTKAKEADASAKNAASSASTAQGAASTATTKAKEADASAKDAGQSKADALRSARNAAQSESNAASSADVSKTNADNAILAKKAATDSAAAAALSEKKAKEYAEAATAITQAQGTVYIDADGYINILEVQTDENTN